MTLDPSALRHILSSPAYEKGNNVRHQLGELVGQGRFSAGVFKRAFADL